MMVYLAVILLTIAVGGLVVGSIYIYRKAMSDYQKYLDGED